MKPTIFLIVVVVIGLIGFLLFGSTSEAPSETPEVEVSQTEESTEMESETEIEIETEAMAVPGDPVPGIGISEEQSGTIVLDSDDDADGAERVFTLDAFSFGYSEEELRVNVGDTVTINLTNSAGFHDWVVDEFSAATEKISEGETTSVTFVADEAGTFEYYCSVGNHRAQGMVGKLIVE